MKKVFGLWRRLSTSVDAFRPLSMCVDPSRQMSAAVDRRRQASLFLFLPLLLLTSCSPSPEPSSPIRILSLAPSLTEILFALDPAPPLIGRTDSCDFPPEASAIPSTGAFGEPDLERLLALRPTHVVYVDLHNKTLPDLLRRHNIEVLHIPCDQLNDIAPAIRQLGELAKLRGKSDALATTIENSLSELRGKFPPLATRPGVFLLMWHDPLMTVGGGSFITDLVHLAGGRNIAADTPNPYFNVSLEWVVTQNPEMILSLVETPPGVLRKRLSENPGWASTRAIRENRVLDTLPLDLICRPGPRILEAVEAIQQALEK